MGTRVVKPTKVKNKSTAKKDDRVKGNVAFRPWFFEESKVWTGIKV